VFGVNQVGLRIDSVLNLKIGWGPHVSLLPCFPWRVPLPRFLMHCMLGSTVGSCWDQPSALAGIDRRLLLDRQLLELRSARTLNLTQQTEEEEDEQ
jgi:hypothetical protein